MALTPEEEAELWVELENEFGRPAIPRPKVVVRDDRVKRDADVHVSRADPNAKCMAVHGDRLVEVRVKDIFGKRPLTPEAKRVLGVDEGYVDGRLAIVGYWKLVDDKPRYVEVEKPANRVQSEYNPFSKERMP